MDKKKFAIIGVGGYIAPRHIEAIKETGNDLVVALDPNDSVGILDKYFDDVDFFTEFERFDRHLEKIRQKEGVSSIDYISICSPNYLHDSHIRFALRHGAHAICEKPVVLNPWNLELLEQLEEETGKTIYTLLQLREHPTLLELKQKIEADTSDHMYDIELTYITGRGNWYHHSWKGDIAKSGGVGVNIGIHFFDMLIWIFGSVKECELHYHDKRTMSGYLELERGIVRWFLSIDREHLPEKNKQARVPFRSIKVDGEEIEFSKYFTDLHTVVYRSILEGKGYTIKDAKPSIQLSYDLRTGPVVDPELGRTHKNLKLVRDI